MAEKEGYTVEFLPDSPVVQMLVIPQDSLAEAKEAVGKLGPKREASDEEEEGPGGDEEVLGLSGSNCRRTRRRDIHCNDED